MLRRARGLVVCLLLTAFCGPLSAEWKPGQAPIMTRWAKDVDPDNVLPEYPRPQLARDAWLNLNGLWDFAIAATSAGRPQNWDGQILVPFPVESALSGVMKSVSPEQTLWYRRQFRIPAANTQAGTLWQGQRILLHCGAADWSTTVWVDGQEVGRHQGGYDPFTFDITAALTAAETHEIIVAVTDPTDASYQPRGKQIRNPHGIWYTSITGIWQTLWLEPVPQTYFSQVKVTTDIDQGIATLQPTIVGESAGTSLEVLVTTGKNTFNSADGPGGDPLKILIPEIKLWSPETPHLYPYKLILRRGQQVVDTVTGYFAMRKISLKPDAQGNARIALNDRVYFQYGPLDQGYWPDGLYTAPTDEALRYDIEVTRELGFNMARKHVKVEPARWYYWCDRIGLLVWQDMPSGDRYIGDRDPDIERAPESVKQFEKEWLAIMAALDCHPSIVMWVPFNEGWGQFDTARITELTKKTDPTRLVNNASGWADRNVGDVHDYHVYPGPAMPPLNPQRASVLGEFGGLGLPVDGHTWQSKDNWGYRSYTNREDLQNAYLNLMQQLRGLVSKGLSAAVYTQTTDVEIEVNGLLTYDRAVMKVDPKVLKAAHNKLTLPAPELREVIATSRENAQTWKYSTSKPADSWLQPDFKDDLWQEGPGGFGTEDTPGTVVRTRWDTPDIWLRRTISLPESTPGEWALQIHHDEDTEIYLDGKLLAQTKGYTTSYSTVRLSDEAVKLLTPGEHVLAVHTHQTGGGQYIDVGLIQFIEPPETLIPAK